MTGISLQMGRRILRYLVSACAAASLCAHTKGALAVDSSPSPGYSSRAARPIDADAKELQMTSDDLEQRGKELRAALQRAYQKLVDSHQLRGNGTDVTEAVLPYIPIGTSFDEAEAILRGAGFSIEPRPDISRASDPNRSKDWYAVLAIIPRFVQKFPFKVSIYVSLLPKSPKDYTNVTKLSATFFISMP